MSVARCVTTVALVAISCSDATAAPKYLMPRELVEYAQRIGCNQVEDFFDVDGMIGPPYVYGYFAGRPGDSAVFWCEKRTNGDRQFVLAIKGAPEPAHPTRACPTIIPWHNYPGGLALYQNPRESLEDFAYLDTPEAKGPRGESITHNAIESRVPGLSTTFYCHKGRWLIRSRH